MLNMQISMVNIYKFSDARTIEKNFYVKRTLINMCIQSFKRISKIDLLGNVFKMRLKCLIMQKQLIVNLKWKILEIQMANYHEN